jgi:hypothetical protein
MNTIKKWLIILMLSFFGYISLASAQSANKSKVMDFGTWDKEITPASKISISSYVTKQKILMKGVGQNPIPESSKYRYELVLQSKSVYNGQPTKTWIYGARVFIDSLEVTSNQSPDGFTAIINTEPTIIFRYDSKMDTINIKITWKSSNYYRDR